MSNSYLWIQVCTVTDIEKKDVFRFEHGHRTFAIYHSPNGHFYATDGYCTHEKVHLADGLVMGNLIECPKHNGRFDYTTGEPKRKPVCNALKSLPNKGRRRKNLYPFKSVILSIFYSQALRICF